MRFRSARNNRSTFSDLGDSLVNSQIAFAKIINENAREGKRSHRRVCVSPLESNQQQLATTLRLAKWITSQR